MRKILHLVLLALIASATVLAGCGGRAYVYEAVDRAGFRERAESQSEAEVQVSAAVLGREETTAVFGIDLYNQGIQPIWLEIDNAGEIVTYEDVQIVDTLRDLPCCSTDQGGETAGFGLPIFTAIAG